MFDAIPSQVLVGGGTGFIGREVCRQLDARGFEVVIASRTRTPMPSSGFSFASVVERLIPSPMPPPEPRASGGRITWSDLARDGFPEGTVAVVNVAGLSIFEQEQTYVFQGLNPMVRRQLRVRTSYVRFHIPANL